MIRPEELAPEEHLAAYGDRADHRTKIWRQTFGPGQRPSGARFRDEVGVCTQCKNVTISRLSPPGECFGTTDKMVRRMDAMSSETFQRWGHKLSDTKLKQLVPEPCDGIRMSPTAELGFRWLGGHRLEQR